MRELEAAAKAGDDRARLALEVFVARAAAEIAAAATALDRLDALVFTGGIGTHSAAMREAICRRLGTLRVPVPSDGGSDGGSDADRLVATGSPAVVVVTAREELVIARDVARVVTN